MEKTALKKDFTFLNSNALKILAVIFMLSDHLWAANFLHLKVFNLIGRLAFPIFAFQIAEGFKYTKDYKKYWQRLLIFAFISEIPFNLFHEGGIINPFHQNVIFTLFYGLWAIKILDNLINADKKDAKTIAKGIFSFLGVWLLSFLTFPDYGALGMLTVVLFYVSKYFPMAKLLQLVGMVLLHWTFVEGEMLVFEPFGREINIPVQAFAVLALIPIWLYNGKKGKSSKTLQYGFYVFYPAHMLIIYLATYFAS